MLRSELDISPKVLVSAPISSLEVLSTFDDDAQRDDDAARHGDGDDGGEADRDGGDDDEQERAAALRAVRSVHRLRHLLAGSDLGRVQLLDHSGDGGIGLTHLPAHFLLRGRELLGAGALHLLLMGGEHSSRRVRVLSVRGVGLLDGLLDLVVVRGDELQPVDLAAVFDGGLQFVEMRHRLLERLLRLPYLAHVRREQRFAHCVLGGAQCDLGFHGGVGQRHLVLEDGVGGRAGHAQSTVPYDPHERDHDRHDAERHEQPCSDLQVR